MESFAYREQNQPDSPPEESTTMKFRISESDRQVALEVTRRDRRIHSKAREKELQRMGWTASNMASRSLEGMLYDDTSWQELELEDISIE